MLAFALWPTGVYSFTECKNINQWTACMQKLGFTQWTNLLEVVTGVVVIITLVFVGIEIRQNTAAIKMQAHSTALDKLDARHYLLATDSDLHRIVTMAKASRGDMSEEEWSRFTLLELPHIALWEFLHDSRIKDNIDEIQWQGFERYFFSLYCETRSPMKVVYHENIAIWSDVFATYVGEIDSLTCESYL